MNTDETPDNFDTGLNERLGVVLDEFERSWHSSQEHCPIEEFLQRTRELETSVTLYWLLSSELELRRRREPEPQVEDYHRRFPLHVSIVDAVFRDTPSTISLASTVLAGDPGRKRLPPSSIHGRPKTAATEEQGPPRFGTYELLEQVGAGGMGIVYRASHTTTGRTVALKMIRSERLMMVDVESRHRELARFRTEMQAATQLEHDHIVTVYEVGEVSGRPFYSMQYVEGATLAQMIGNGPLCSRPAAELIAPIARAIAACHGVHVLHRDLKPSNILVQSGTQRPLVTDFGLAKLLEGDSELTTSGAHIGTPPYMSPEQALDSSKATELSDVYSLGATLYHLITGRPPFQASSSSEVFRQIAEKDPVAPRQLNPEVDRDIETVCLHCLEKEPGARYGSATELANDLERYLNQEPILARPIGPAKRLFKWARRRPAIASLAVLLIVSLIVGFAGITSQYLRAEVALKSSEDNLERANHNLIGAIDAIDFVGREVGVEGLGNVPQMQRLRRRILERAAEFSEELLKNNAENPGARRAAGLANLICGDIRTTFGEYDSAQEAYLTAEEVFTNIAHSKANDKEVQRGLARSWYSMANLALRRGNFDDAARFFNKLDAEFSGVATESEEDLELLGVYAALLDFKARRFIARKDYKSAGPIARKTLTVQKRLFEEVDGTRVDRKCSLARAYSLHAIVLRHTGEFRQAESVYRDAIELLDQAVNDSPMNTETAAMLGTAWRNLAIASREAGSLREALAAYEKATRVFEKLTRDFPETVSYHSELAQALHGAAIVCRAMGNLDRAASLIDRVVFEQREVVSLAPADSGYKTGLRNQIYAVSVIRAELGDHAQAASAIEEFLKLAVEPIDHKNAVKMLIVCMQLANGDTDLPADKRQAIADRFALRAIEILRNAREQQLISPEAIRADAEHDFAELMSYQEFKALLDHGEASPSGPADDR